MNNLFLTFLFIIMVGGALLVDLFYIKHDNKETDKVSFKDALIWSIIWILLALLFNLILYLKTKNFDKAMEFLAGYLVEKSLSLDNIFVFVTVFEYFNIIEKHQRKVLLIGILTAIAARAIFIFGGIYIVNKFHWVLYIFGIILIYSGLKILKSKEEKKEISEMKIIRFLSTHFPVTDRIYGDRLIVKINNKIYLTPLFIVMIVVEISDIIFAIDSIPAIFAITLDPFIVYTSNIFAILGLRALYFLVSGLKARFYYLKHGISIILTFVGIKILISNYIKIKPALSVLLIFVIITASIIASILRKGGNSSATT